MPSPRRRVSTTAAALFALLSSSPLEAQGRPTHFQRIAHEEGLSNPTITAIAQDARGFLWIGTQDGLNVFDGSSFTVFRPVPGDTTSMASAWVTALEPSRGGWIWAGLSGSGIHRFDPANGRSRRYRHDAFDPASLASDMVTSMLEDDDGVLWVGTGSGVDALDTATGRVRHFSISTRVDSGRLANDVLELLEVPGQPLWVGTRLGVYLLDRETGVVAELPVSLLTREIRAMVLDRQGVVWVAAYDDLVAIDSRTHKVLRQFRRRPDATHPLVANGINAMTLDPDGSIWIGTDAGVVRLDPETAAFERLSHDADDPRTLGGPIARVITFDRGGVLWIGHESYGLSKHSPTAVTFSVLRKDPASERSLSDGYIRGIAQDRAGNVWVATQNGGLNRIDARSGRIRAFRHRPDDPRSLPGDNVWAFHEDRRGVIWIGLHTRGLGTFDPATGVFTRSDAVPANASVNVLYEDRRGTLYVGLEGIGMVTLSPDRRTIRSYGYSFGDQRVMAGNDVQSILEDRAGMLWVGGADGLTRFDRARSDVAHYGSDPARAGTLSSTFVTNIVQDSRGTIWVATKGGGLNRYDPATDSFTAIGTADGLPHNFVYGILEDARKRLWISTDNGIAMFDPASGFVTRYDLTDGLQAREFNRRAHLRAADGTMYLGGINGVTIFNPDLHTAVPPPPQVRFVTIESGGRRRPAIGLTIDSVVRLRHDESAVTIAFAALDFAAPEKIQYAYQLEGVDAEWVKAGNRNQATYAGLSPGRRVFRVRAASPTGVWSDLDAGVTIVVTPAWWATWWARTLQGLLLVAAVAAVVRLRLRSARLRAQELERRVDDKTRDLVSAQQQLAESLARQREAAEELIEITAAVPGAVFQLRETADGRRTFEFVSHGIGSLCRGAGIDVRDPRRAADALLSHIDPADQQAFEESLAISRAALDTWRIDVRWLPTGGTVISLRWLSIQAHPARLEDASTVWTGVMTDATAAHRAEDERVALESRVLLAQKEESLAILAGGVAHDFNNVLVSVVLGAELLQKHVAADPAATDLVGRIRSAGQRASELTQQMLAYTGKGHITVEPVNLTALAHDMLTLVRAAIPRIIELDFQADARSAVVEADATQLRQVVLNLVTNAGEAIGDSVGRVRVRVDVVPGPRRALQLLHASPGMPERGPYVLLEVSDSGCGIEPALLERIFDPFFTTKFTGRGLGLAALRGIVRAHRGGLNVITAPRQGTRFQIYLPRSEALVETRAPERPGVYAGETTRSRVLIADDERDLARVAGSLLERLGYEVIVVSNGEELLERGEAGGIDVMLLDVMMPRLNGATAAQMLRERGVRTPIVLMSGYAEEDLVTRGLTAESTVFLKKPFLSSELVDAIRAAMRSAGDRVAATRAAAP